jgi:GNAT superfamily N-acetyltransferase
MASTKEMQRRAKQERKNNHYVQTVMTEREHIFAQVEAVALDLDIVEIGPLQVAAMYQDFKRDYAAAGDTISDHNHLYADGSSESTYKIVYQGQTAGFINFFHLKDPMDNRDVKIIQVAYVKPEFRGRGIMSAVYMWALDIHNAEGIEVSYQRVTGREIYWASMGFYRICPVPGQVGTGIGLCVLSKNPTIGWPLTPERVRDCRSLANRVDTTNLRRMPSCA